ncbi:MAG: DUF1376 domain-containing protein [Alphaproteobacteria bacterium]|nr:DUF1376 domain-containing protein [Alphaproteobacteria bacterium]
MTDALPPPLVPADADLRDFAYMPLDVVRLRDSDLAALAGPEEFRSAVMLWCASWHQIPAASVPDDDKILANLAGFGRGVTDWKKVREGALRGWVKCSDGRLYHPVVAEKANDALDGKRRNAHKKLCDRLRKAGLNSDGIPSFERWNSDGMPMDGHYISAGNTPPIPRKSGLKGRGERERGEGKGESISPESSSSTIRAESADDDAPPEKSFGLSDAEFAFVEQFDTALVATFGESARRKRLAGGDPDSARKLRALKLTPERFGDVCRDVMGRLAVSGREPPQSLAYCLKAAIEDTERNPGAAASVSDDDPRAKAFSAAAKTWLAMPEAERAKTPRPTPEQFGLPPAQGGGR